MPSRAYCRLLVCIAGGGHETNMFQLHLYHLLFFVLITTAFYVFVSFCFSYFIHFLPNNLSSFPTFCFSSFALPLSSTFKLSPFPPHVLLSSYRHQIVIFFQSSLHSLHSLSSPPPPPPPPVDKTASGFVTVSSKFFLRLGSSVTQFCTYDVSSRSFPCPVHCKYFLCTSLVFNFTLNSVHRLIFARSFHLLHIIVKNLKQTTLIFKFISVFRIFVRL